MHYTNRLLLAILLAPSIMLCAHESEYVELAPISEPTDQLQATEHEEMPSDGDILNTALALTTINTIPGIRVELRYATTKNITGQRIYTKETSCYVLEPVAYALANVQEELETMGYGLIIWDGYQSPEAQQKIWDLIANETIVSNPATTIDGHAQGIAVDASLYYLDSGRKVTMPTDFDSLSVRACLDCQDFPAHVLKNRNLLIAIMKKHGFIPTNQSSWWHFEYQMPVQ